MKTFICLVVAGLAPAIGSDEDSGKVYNKDLVLAHAREQQPPSPDGQMVGRYLLMPAKGELFRIDTATGKVWVLQVIESTTDRGRDISGAGWKVVNESASADLLNRARAAKAVQNVLDLANPKVPEDAPKPVRKAEPQKPATKAK